MGLNLPDILTLSQLNDLQMVMNLAHKDELSTYLGNKMLSDQKCQLCFLISFCYQICSKTTFQSYIGAPQQQLTYQSTCEKLKEKGMLVISK